MIEVFLAKALICFNATCYPALVGNATPIGQFQAQRTYVTSPGYGGDVLEFAHDNKGIYAIHRIYLLNPKQHRAWRLAHGTAEERHITDGCINVAPEVYNLLPVGPVIIKE